MAAPENVIQLVERFERNIDDYRSGKYQIGQITLVESEIMDTVSRELGYEIPAGASRRQIMVGGITLNGLIGQNLRLGPVLVRVEDTDLERSQDEYITSILQTLQWVSLDVDEQ